MILTEEQFLRLDIDFSNWDRRCGLQPFFFEQSVDPIFPASLTNTLGYMLDHYKIFYEFDYTKVEKNLEDLPFLFGELPGLKKVHFMNTYILSEALIASWMSLRNGIRDVIKKNKQSFKPMAIGEIETFTNVQLGVQSLVKYLLDEGIDLELNESELTFFLSKGFSKIVYKIYYFVSEDAEYVYFTMDSNVMLWEMFLVFLKELLFAISYINRMDITWDPSKGIYPHMDPEVETDEGKHWKVIKDYIHYYNSFCEAYKDSEILKPSLVEVKQYFHRLHFYLEKYEGDFSELRGNDYYDPIESLGGLKNLYRTFVTFFFGGLLRCLTQGSFIKPSEYGQGFFQRKLMEYVGCSKDVKYGHFNFFWDVNFTMSAKEYYYYTLEEMHSKNPKLRNYLDTTLLYDPQWISEGLKSDLINFLKLVKPSISLNENKIYPLMGFDLNWDELTMEKSRSFDRVLGAPSEFQQFFKKNKPLGYLLSYQDCYIAMYNSLF